MMDIAVDFYKKLFAKESDANVKLGPSFWEDNDKVTSLYINSLGSTRLKII